MAERQTKSWSPLITNIVSGITILLTSTVLGLAIKINDNVAENSTKIARIEGNRFTSAHGLEVWRAIGEIKADIAKLPQEVPPPWFATGSALPRAKKRLESGMMEAA